MVSERPFQSHFHLKEHFFHRRPFRLIYGASRIPQHDEGCRPSSLRPQHPNLYRHLKQRLGRSLRASSAKGLWSGRKKATHKCSRAEDGLWPLESSRTSVKSDSVGCHRQLNSSSLHIKQGGTHSAEMCSPPRFMTWCHPYKINLRVRHIPGCLNVMANLLSRLNQVQSTEWSLHPLVFKQICQSGSLLM